MKSVIPMILGGIFVASGVALLSTSGADLSAFVALVKNPPKAAVPEAIAFSASAAFIGLYLLVAYRRAFVSLAATALFMYCSLKLYVLADGNVEKIVDAIVSPVTPKELLLVVGAAVSLAVIIYLALRTTKIIVTQDETFDALERQLVDTTAWISAREGKHAKAALLKTEYVALMARRAALVDPSSGLSALMRQLASLRAEHDSEVGSLMVSGDTLRLLDELPARIDEARTLLGQIEQAAVALPNLKEHVQSIVARAAKLEEGSTVRASDIGELHGRLDELLDEQGDGKIANLNEGHSDYTGTFAEQVAELVKNADDVEKALSAIEEAAAKLPDLLTQETAFQARTRRLDDKKTGVLARVRDLFDRFDDIFDGGEGGRIGTIKKGINGKSGDLEEQLEELLTLAATIKEELAKLDEVPTQIGEIRRSLAEASQPSNVKAAG